MLHKVQGTHFARSNSKILNARIHVKSLPAPTSFPNEILEYVAFSAGCLIAFLPDFVFLPGCAVAKL